MGRQIINTKRKGWSPRAIVRLVIFVVFLIALAIGTFFWLHRHVVATAWKGGATYHGPALVFSPRRLTRHGT